MTIDWWTLGLQTVNVAVLVWLLQRFFWRPVAAMIELRRDTTRKALAEAEATKGRANTALAEIEKTRAGFAKERETILVAAHDAAEQAGAARLAQPMTRMWRRPEDQPATAAIETANASRRRILDRLRGQPRGRYRQSSGRAARWDGGPLRFSRLAHPGDRSPERYSGDERCDALEVVSATTLDPAEQEAHARAG